MPIDVIDTCCTNALYGLYLTPDLEMCGNYIVRKQIGSVVNLMHKRQLLTDHYSILGGIVQECYHDWHDHKLRTGDVMMMAADLSKTYWQITHGLMAALYLTGSILERTMGIADDGDYCRVIPDELEDMRINHIDDITVETICRILSIDPWQSWMEMLRAQKNRSARVLEVPLSIDEIIANGKEMELRSTQQDKLRDRKIIKSYRAARKSIKKSVKLADNLGSLGLLRTFLQSKQDELSPLVLEGKLYNYHLLFQRELIDATINCNVGMAPAVATAVYSKTERKRICEMCLYFPDTPPLDHVLAMALYVQNEESELDLLKGGWVVDAPRAFFDDPILPTLKGLLRPNQTPTLIQGIMTSGYFCGPVSRREIVASKRSLAFLAFKQIMAPGKSYLPLLNLLGRQDTWDYVIVDDDAKAMMQLVQKTIWDDRW